MGKVHGPIENAIAVLRGLESQLERISDANQRAEFQREITERISYLDRALTERVDAAEFAVFMQEAATLPRRMRQAEDGR